VAQVGQGWRGGGGGGGIGAGAAVVVVEAVVGSGTGIVLAGVRVGMPRVDGAKAAEGGGMVYPAPAGGLAICGRWSCREGYARRGAVAVCSLR
jgi:hypothetical protein